MSDECRVPGLWSLCQQRSGDRDLGVPVTRGEESIVADFDEARWQNVETKAADELLQAQRHALASRRVRIVFVGET